jgi:hypothetical protein
VVSSSDRQLYKTKGQKALPTYEELNQNCQSKDDSRRIPGKISIPLYTIRIAEEFQETGRRMLAMPKFGNDAKT